MSDPVRGGPPAPDAPTAYLPEMLDALQLAIVDRLYREAFDAVWEADRPDATAEAAQLAGLNAVYRAGQRAVVPPPPDTAAAPTEPNSPEACRARYERMTLDEKRAHVLSVIRLRPHFGLTLDAEAVAWVAAELDALSLAAAEIDRLRAVRAPAPATDDAPTDGMRTGVEYVAQAFEVLGEQATADRIRLLLSAFPASPRATAPARNPMGEMPDGLTEADLIGGEF
jgi:hypothetical protein